MLIYLFLIFFIIYYFISKPNLEQKKTYLINYNNYINNFNKNDMNLRNCKDKNKCITKYNNSVLALSKNEKNNLDLLLKNFYKKINGNFKKILKNINILKIKNNIDANLPHTNKYFIILSENVFDYVLKSGIENENVFKLLVHEQFHVFQRYNYKLISKLYTKYWDMIKVNTKLPKYLLDKIRSNPDVKDHWIYKIKNDKYILPLSIYSDYSYDISDIKIVYVNVTYKNNKYIFDNKFNNLKENNKFTNFFGNNLINKYHPHEISASIFEEIVLNKLKLGNKPNYNAFNQMLKFLKDEKLY